MSQGGGGQIVVVKRDGDDGPVYPLPQGSIHIGSGKDCELRIPQKGLPQKQCIITIQNQQAILKNLSSTVPLLVNNKPVDTKVLAHGDMLSSNYAKFRWDYLQQQTESSKKAKGPSRPKFVIKKRGRKSIGRRKSDSTAKKVDPQIKKLMYSRNSLDSLLGGTSKTRQVAVVKPQRRDGQQYEVQQAEVAGTLGAMSVANRNRTTLTPSSGRKQVKRTRIASPDVELLVTNKRRKINDIEKVDTPVVLDKNKRAALMLLTGKSPMGKLTPKSKGSPTTKVTVDPNIVDLTISATPIKETPPKTPRSVIKSTPARISNVKSARVASSASKVMVVKEQELHVTPVTVASPTRSTAHKNTDKKSVAVVEVLDTKKSSRVTPARKLNKSAVSSSNLKKSGNISSARIKAQSTSKLPVKNVSVSKFTPKNASAKFARQAVSAGRITHPDSNLKKHSILKSSSKTTTPLSVNAIKKTPASLVTVKSAKTLISPKGKTIFEGIESQGCAKKTSRRKLQVDTIVTNVELSTRSIRKTPSVLSALATKTQIAITSASTGQSAQKKSVKKSNLYSPKKRGVVKLQPRKILPINPKTFYKKTSPTKSNPKKTQQKLPEIIVTDVDGDSPRYSLPASANIATKTPKSVNLNTKSKTPLKKNTESARVTLKSLKNTSVKGISKSPKATPKLVKNTPKSITSVKVTPKSPKVTPKSAKVAAKSPKVTPKSAKVATKSPKVTPKSAKVTPKSANITKSSSKSKTPIKVTPKSKTQATPKSVKNNPKSKTPLKDFTKSPMAIPKLVVITPKTMISAKVTPKSKTPVKTTPKSKTPVKITSKSMTPVKITPKSMTPVKTTPKSKTPVKTTPKSKTPLKTTQKPKTPVKNTPKSKTPVNITPKSKTPVKTTPKSKPLVEITPKSKTPLKTTPKSKTSIKVSPKSKTPIKNSPKQLSQMKTPIVKNVKSTPKSVQNYLLISTRTSNRKNRPSFTPKRPSPVRKSTLKRLSTRVSPVHGKTPAKVVLKSPPKSTPRKSATNINETFELSLNSISPMKNTSRLSSVASKSVTFHDTTFNSSSEFKDLSSLSELNSFNSDILSDNYTTPQTTYRSTKSSKRSPSLLVKSNKTITPLNKRVLSKRSSSHSTKKSTQKPNSSTKRFSQCTVNISPIVSPKQSSPRTPDSFIMIDDDNIVTTPNLSILFDMEASTPKDARRSTVKDKKKHYEIEKLAQNVGRLSKVTRKTLGSLGENVQRRISELEAISGKSQSEPRNKYSPAKKSKLRNSYRLSKTSANKPSDQVSNSSDATDVNAPQPDNEIVITPKSTVKLPPELLKEKHSTAKKSVSRKAMIDHLTESPDIAKELFKSPVKRKLSQSIRLYNSSIDTDVADVSIASAVKDASFELLNSNSKRPPRQSKSTPNVSFELLNSSSKRSLRKSKSSPNVSFDFASARTPHVTTDIFVSPLQNSTLNETTRSSRSSAQCRSLFGSPNNMESSNKSPIIRISPKSKSIKKNKSPKNDLTNIFGVKELLSTPRAQKSPVNDLTNIIGVKQLLRTPRPAAKSPKNDLTNVGGVKRILRTPVVAKSPRNDLTNVAGVKKLMATPKPTRSPKNDLTNVAGVKKVLKTPRAPKSPRNDLTNVAGVKKLMATPKPIKSPKNDLTNIAGVKKVLKTPRAPKSPRNSLTNVTGVKELLATPKPVKSPRNDLSNVAGVKKLLSTPKPIKSPKNDLTNVNGVKTLLKSPRLQRSPKNDLTNVQGVKSLLKTPARPQKSPKNDLSQVHGVKQLMKTPGKGKPVPKSPKNDLTNVAGVKSLFRSPQKNKSPKNSLENVSGVADLFEPSPKTSENMFDSLVGRSPVRTYSNKVSIIITKPSPEGKKQSSITNESVEVSTIRNNTDRSLETLNVTEQRSRRQVTIDKTNYSIEVSKVQFSVKESKVKQAPPNVSILGQSTPAKTRKRAANTSEINIKQLSPILSVPQKVASPKMSPKAKPIRGKSQNVAQTKGNKRGQKKNEENQGETLVQVEKEVKFAVASKKTGKRTKEEITKETDFSSSKLEESMEKKKKVTFASDVLDVDDKPASSRGTRSSKRGVAAVAEQTTPKRQKKSKPTVVKNPVSSKEPVAKKTAQTKTKKSPVKEVEPVTLRGRKRAATENVPVPEVKKQKSEKPLSDKVKKEADIPKETKSLKETKKAANKKDLKDTNASEEEAISEIPKGTRRAAAKASVKTLPVKTTRGKASSAKSSKTKASPVKSPVVAKKSTKKTAAKDTIEKSPKAAAKTKAAAKKTKAAAKTTKAAAKTTKSASKATKTAAKTTKSAAKTTKAATKTTKAAAKTTKEATKSSPKVAAAKKKVTKVVVASKKVARKSVNNSPKATRSSRQKK